MRTLSEVESDLLERKHAFTTFKQCSFDEEHQSFICANETIRVFDLDEVKEAFSKGKYSAPMSMDALWIDHEQQTLHIVEFKNVKKLEGSKKKDIRLKILDTLLLLNGELKVNQRSHAKMSFIIVRTLGEKDRVAYHVMAKARKYTPAYLNYVTKLTGIDVMELTPEDFEKYIVVATKFRFEGMGYIA